MYNIAFIHHRFDTGGISAITKNIVHYLSEHSGKYKVFIIVDSPEYAVLPEDIRGKAEAIVSKNLTDAVKRYGIDILIQLSRREPGIAGIKDEGRCKVVFADHGQPFNERYAIIDRRMGGRRRRPLKRLIWEIFLKKRYTDGGKALELATGRTKAAYNESDAYVVLCDTYRDEISAATGDASKIWVIENPGIKRRNVSFEKEKLVIFVGRLSDYDKKVDRLLRVWKSVQQRLPGWKLEIVGDGYERRRLEKLASELGLERTSFEGMQTNPESYYRRASILCLVSQTEGWPLCLVEAQSYGVIPVAFNCSGGVTKILEPDGKNGFTVPPADEEAFAETLVKVANLPENEKLAIRKSVIQKASEITEDTAGAKWLALFDSLTASTNDGESRDN